MQGPRSAAGEHKGRVPGEVGGLGKFIGAVGDKRVVEARRGMQRGRASPAFQGGAFSPAMDGPTHCFHKWMAGALLGTERREARLSAV